MVRDGRDPEKSATSRFLDGCILDGSYPQLRFRFPLVKVAWAAAFPDLAQELGTLPAHPPPELRRRRRHHSSLRCHHITPGTSQSKYTYRRRHRFRNQLACLNRPGLALCSARSVQLPKSPSDLKGGHVIPQESKERPCTTQPLCGSASEPLLQVVPRTSCYPVQQTSNGTFP
jgi:hypothetical protein